MYLPVDLKTSHFCLTLDQYLYSYQRHTYVFTLTFYTNLKTLEFCKEAKLQARIKPTALCSAIDKKNSIKFLLDFLYYLYNYYMVCTLLSHACHVTCHVTSCDCDYVILVT